jgi:hypothetical protein
VLPCFLAIEAGRIGVFTFQSIGSVLFKRDNVDFTYIEANRIEYQE